MRRNETKRAESGLSKPIPLEEKKKKQMKNANGKGREASQSLKVTEKNGVPGRRKISYPDER